MHTIRHATAIAVLLASALHAGIVIAYADTQARTQNLVDLVRDAEVIIHGDVASVTDGFEAGVPYTEVTVRVKETLRGSTGEVYTFRQFGLIAPRRMGNGLVSYMVTPVDWPTYRTKEEVVLFLFRAARRTGLRTTVGLGQGKFSITGGRIVSQAGNRGLFDGVAIEAPLANKAERQMLASHEGAVSMTAFLSVVRRAVSERWVETRTMRHAD
jgi:hypothetical protein